MSKHNAPTKEVAVSETNDVNALVMRMRDKVTKDEVEQYISYAELEAGPACCDEWFDTISQFLRMIYADA